MDAVVTWRNKSVEYMEGCKDFEKKLRKEEG
jgi:hypothetical protein